MYISITSLCTPPCHPKRSPFKAGQRSMRGNEDRIHTSVKVCQKEVCVFSVLLSMEGSGCVGVCVCVCGLVVCVCK